MNFNTNDIAGESLEPAVVTEQSAVEATGEQLKGGRASVAKAAMEQVEGLLPSNFEEELRAGLEQAMEYMREHPNARNILLDSTSTPDGHVKTCSAAFLRHPEMDNAVSECRGKIEALATSEEDRKIARALSRATGQLLGKIFIERGSNPDDQDMIISAAQKAAEFVEENYFNLEDQGLTDELINTDESNKYELKVKDRLSSLLESLDPEILENFEAKIEVAYQPSTKSFKLMVRFSLDSRPSEETELASFIHRSDQRHPRKIDKILVVGEIVDRLKVGYDHAERVYLSHPSLEEADLNDANRCSSYLSEEEGGERFVDALSELTGAPLDKIYARYENSYTRYGATVHHLEFASAMLSRQQISEWLG